MIRTSWENQEIENIFNNEMLCAHAEIAETGSEHGKRIVKKLEATRVRDHRSDTTCGQSFDHHRSGGAAAEGRRPA